MPIRELHQFTVEGAGLYGDHLFPFDLLAEGRCWPKDRLDASGIEATTRPAPPRGFRVTLVAIDAPEVERWQSRGWSVVEQTRQRV